MKRGGVIAVIGGNAAGPAAAAKARRQDPDATVLLFEKGEYLSTGSCELPYLFSGEVASFQSLIHFTPDSFYREKEVRAFVNTEVLRIERRAKELHIKDVKTGCLRSLTYDSLIIATGSRARTLPQLAPYTNAFTFKTIADYCKLSERLKTVPGAPVVIIGAGYIGVELAESLAAAGYQVSLLDSAPVPLHGAEPEISKLALTALASAGISFRGNCHTISCASDSGMLTHVTVGNVRTECAAVVVTAGFRPESVLAAAAGLQTDPDGFILVNQRCQTSDPGIFAAGDCITFHPHLCKFPPPRFQAVQARETARVAAVNAAGGSAVYNLPVRNTSVRICGNFYASAGYTQAEALKAGFICSAATAEAWDAPPVMPEAAKVFGKLIINKRSGVILGASFWGSKAVSGYADVIALAVSAAIPVQIAGSTGWNYTPTLSPFNNLLEILFKKSQPLL